MGLARYISPGHCIEILALQKKFIDCFSFFETFKEYDFQALDFFFYFHNKFRFL